ncbi:MAG: hypothetical protein FJ264_15590 [Planctomycetes bacterium]|nr:hypothetical protein [Planctomycetota bacterium]
MRYTVYGEQEKFIKDFLEFRDQMTADVSHLVELGDIVSILSEHVATEHSGYFIAIGNIIWEKAEKAVEGIDEIRAVMRELYENSSKAVTEKEASHG